MNMTHPKTAAALPLLLPLTVLAACGGSDCPPNDLVGPGGGGGGGIDPTNFVSIGDVTLPEGDSGEQQFQFPVTLNSALADPITVHFATVDGSAASGTDDEDFVARTGMLTIPPGTTQTSIAVVVRGDYEYEGEETFFVNLVSVEGADIEIGTAQATGKISDDDGNRFSVSDAKGIEGDVTNPLFWFEVTLSTPQTEPVSVEYVTKDLTAEHGPAPDDYIWRRDTLVFDVGETSKQFEIRIVGDLEVEPDESFEIQLFNPLGAAVGLGDDIGIGTILDDDTEEQLDRALAGSDASAPQLAGVSPFVYAAWQDDRSGGSDIYFSRSVNQGLDWSLTDRRLDTGGPPVGAASEPQIAASGDFVYVVWSDSRNGKSDVYFNRSLDNGATWLASSLRLDTDFPGRDASTRPRIACADDRVYVIWSDWRTGVPCVRFNASFDAGATWMPSDRQLNDAPDFGAPAREPELCADGARVYVVWTDGRNGSSDIYFDASLNGGLEWFAADRRLDTAVLGSASSGRPQIDARDGKVYVVWQDERWGDPDVFFNRSLDDGSTWLPFDMRLNSDPAGTGRSTNPALHSDGDLVMVAWESAKPGESEDIRFTSSIDAGSTWRGNARVDRDDAPGAARSLEPQISSNETRVVVTWTDERNGERDVYVGWSVDDDSTFTTHIIRLDRDVPGDARSEHPRILHDGSSFHVLWEDARDSSDVLFRTVFLP